MADENHAETIANLAIEALHGVVKLTAAGNREFVALPAPGGAYSLQQITQDNAADVLMPKIVKQHVKLQTVNSLIDYVNRFKNHDTVLFADIAKNSIQAIIDYHKMPGANIADAPAVPTEGPRSDYDARARLNQHLATLALPFSEEWSTWTRVSDKLMSHRDFAAFLEENQIDVVSPPGGDLLELCRDLQVINNVNFSSSVRHGDYNKVSYAKENDATAKGEVQLPVSIALAIPVYFGEPRVNVQAFIRRKIDDGHLLLGVKLTRVENIRQDEFHRIVEGVQAGTESQTMYGSAV